MCSFRIQNNTVPAESKSSDAEAVSIAFVDPAAGTLDDKQSAPVKKVISVIVQPPGLATEDRLVFDAVEKSREIVGAARKQADYIVSRAKSESEKHFEEERLRGFEAGRREALNEFWGSISSQKDLLFKSRHAVLELSTRIAKEVIGSELIEQPESILRRIVRAIRSFAGPETIQIFVHSNSLAKVKETLSRFALENSVEIKVDDSLAESDARMLSPTAEVVASVTEHLAAIEAQLKNHFHE